MESGNTTQHKYDLTQKEIERIVDLIVDLGWDYDRFSSGGQKTYESIENILNK